MKCVILQPSYIPWRGYFHQIAKADRFVFYDDVQYDRHGWRNRNRIKSPQGSIWLTIPVETRGVTSQHVTIDRIRLPNHTRWNSRHWATLETSYHRAPFFETYRPALAPFWSRPPDLLADFTIELTVALARLLGIGETRFLRSSTLGAAGHKTERLLSILGALGADHYISGPSARGYLDEPAFASAGITLEYMSYEYPVYEQLHPPFDPQVSILDLLFMKGPEAGRWIWGWGHNDER